MIIGGIKLTGKQPATAKTFSRRSLHWCKVALLIYV